MHSSKYNFTLIDLKNEKQRVSASFINEVFFFWKSFWKKELDDLESPYPNWADEFYRHEHLGILTMDSVPVALHLYARQNLLIAPCREQSYFTSFSEAFTGKLVKDGYTDVLSAGWLTVNSDFVSNPDKIVFSKCLVSLSLKVCDYLGSQAILGPTRINNGVADKVISWGAKTYGQEMAYNTPVELIVIDTDTPIPLRDNERSLVEQIWTLDKQKKIAA